MSLAERGKRVGACGWLIQEAGLTLYIDPCGVSGDLPKADVVCLSMVDPKKVPEREVRLLSTPQTIVAGLPQCVSRFRLNQLPILPGQAKAALGVEIRIVSASDEGAALVLKFPDCELAYP
ncbi:MAG: hypothetical protein HY077_07705 [Elusimicrobia bacterium]|nr:hypothetical protein [Elusimicrobiota bacterium]